MQSFCLQPSDSFQIFFNQASLYSRSAFQTLSVRLPPLSVAVEMKHDAQRDLNQTSNLGSIKENRVSQPLIVL